MIAVNQLSLTVEEGSIFGLIGPNGSGKTTVFNLVTGFYRPTEGEVRLAGRPIGGLPPYTIAALGVVRTFQNIRLFQRLSVLENVLIGHHNKLRTNLLMELFLVSRKRRLELAAKDRCLRLLGLFDLTDLAATPAGRLPYGRQRELEIVRALACGPRLLLLDEPAAGMSPEETEHLALRIRSLRERGLTILLVDHDMRLVMEICDKIAVLDSGEKIAEGTAVEVQDDARVQEAYLGRQVSAGC